MTLTDFCFYLAMAPLLIGCAGCLMLIIFVPIMFMLEAFDLWEPFKNAVREWVLHCFR